MLDIVPSNQFKKDLKLAMKSNRNWSRSRACSNILPITQGMISSQKSAPCPFLYGV